MARILIIRKHNTNNMKRYYILAFYFIIFNSFMQLMYKTIAFCIVFVIFSRSFNYYGEYKY